MFGKYIFVEVKRAIGLTEQRHFLHENGSKVLLS